MNHTELISGTAGPKCTGAQLVVNNSGLVDSGIESDKQRRKWGAIAPTPLTPFPFPCPLYLINLPTKQ